MEYMYSEAGGTRRRVQQYGIAAGLIIWTQLALKRYRLPELEKNSRVNRQA
jgi:hypothetical protein